MGFTKTFDKCPGCGSTERFFEGIANELKGRKLIGEKNILVYDEQKGVCGGDRLIAKIPIGGKVPTFGLQTDICSNCGMVYATRIVEDEAVKSIDRIPPPGKPGLINKN